MLHLTWIDKLLDNIRIIFTDLYGEQLRKPHTSVVECDFDGYFNQQIRELEGSAGKAEQTTPKINIQDVSIAPDGGYGRDDSPPPIPGFVPPGQPIQTPLSASSTPDTSRPTTPASQVLSATSLPKGASRRARKAAAGALNTASSGDEKKPKTKKDSTKKLRRWDDDGLADDDDGTVLDYSAQNISTSDQLDIIASSNEPINTEAAGTRTRKGQFILKDLGSEVHSILQNAEEKKAEQQPAPSKGVVESSLGAISGLFRSVIGGKVLTKADLEKPMKGIEEHLLKKNVAREAAVRLCEGVERELIGVKTGSFECTFSHPPSYLSKKSVTK